MRTLLFLLTVWFFASVTAHATVQEDDGLVVNGESGSIDEQPLTKVISDRRLNFTATSTANYRGYVAQWSIDEGKLYLTDFTGSVRGKKKTLGWLFPKAKGKVPADWYTGTIEVNLGNLRMSKIHGHVAVTDRLTVLAIEKGVVKRRQTFKYPKNIPVINQRQSERFGEKIDIRKIPY
jgi:hypothetical protein